MAARLFLLASWCARHVPLRVAYALAATGGWVAFYAWRRGRANTIANFTQVLPGATPGTVRAVARRSLANYGRYLVDFLRFPDFDPSARMALEAKDSEFAAFARARERGKGVVAVSFHFGNWDLGAATIAALGNPLVAVAETLGDPALHRIIVAQRERLGIRIVPMERAGPSLLRSLKRNDILALLADRPMTKGGVRVPFFGAQVEVPGGPARLAMAAGSLVMPIGLARISPWSDRVRALLVEPFAPFDTGDAEADLNSTMAAIFAAYEDFIRACPDQWYMFRRMWPEVRPA